MNSNTSEMVNLTSSIKRRRILKMSYNKSPKVQRRIAAIRLAGFYLENLGFNPDGWFSLTINDDLSLTIRPAIGPDEDDQEEKSAS